VEAVEVPGNFHTPDTTAVRPAMQQCIEFFRKH
jgi:hypothetical protein